MSPKPSAELMHVQIEAIENLASCVTELTGQIEVLRNVLDEIREDFAWAVQNGRLSTGQLPRPFVLKRMAADPTAPDWAERLNREPQAPHSEPSAILDEGTPTASTSPSAENPPDDNLDDDPGFSAGGQGHLFS